MALGTLQTVNFSAIPIRIYEQFSTIFIWNTDRFQIVVAHLLRDNNTNIYK